MQRITQILLLISALTLGTVIAGESELEGEVKVMLIFTQSTGPRMLNRIRADIGASEPEPEVWHRGAVTAKKLKPGNYTIVATRTEVCSFDDCVPCPDRSRSIYVSSDETINVHFRWKARWDRVEKKWTCQ